MKIAVNGLGRIGRGFVRNFFEKNLDGIELVAINTPASVDIIQHLLQYDSVFGKFQYDVNILENADLEINGKYIKYISERDPENINWDDLNVDVVLECSGKFNKKDLANKHLKRSINKNLRVIISAPVLDADRTIIFGINNEDLSCDDRIISVGSCTTNCFLPVFSSLNSVLGLDSGFVTTVHAYTSDQNVLDNSHKDFRRSRACGLSMIPTSSGVSKVLTQIFPETEGKFSGSSIRVPVPNVSLIDFSFVSNNNTSVEEINYIMKSSSENELLGILGYCNLPLVSVDFVANKFSAIFDALETKVVGDNFCRVVAWYDNESGFINRMLDILGLIKNF